jgi:hypothetical protein
MVWIMIENDDSGKKEFTSNIPVDMYKCLLNNAVSGKIAIWVGFLSDQKKQINYCG